MAGNATTSMITPPLTHNTPDRTTHPFAPIRALCGCHIWVIRAEFWEILG